VRTALNILSGISESVNLLLRRPRRGQYAALCYRLAEGQRSPEILVVTSRDSGRWVIPKGWPMTGKAGHEVACQEAMEEAGVLGEAELQPAGSYCYDKGYDEGYSVPCEVQVYPLRVTGHVDEFKEKGKRRIEWVTPATAEARVREPQLKRLIHRFADRFASADA
jgi:8-oxo-dGTP pyrophosphatase MutT (NUDIX family)